MKTFVKSIVLSAIFSFLNGATAAPSVISSYRIQGLPDAQVQKIADHFEITRAKGNAFEVLVPEQNRALFLSLAPKSVLMKVDISAEVRRTYQLNRSSKRRAGYHSFAEVTQILQSIAVSNPKNTQLVNYGKSKMGKPLLALRVSNQLQTLASIPRVVLTAATHGDEIITTEILLNLMNEFVLGAVSNPRFAAILSKIEVVFIPVVNPDGFSEQDRYDNGADPNRSYPYPGNPTAIPTASIAGMIEFARAYPMIGSIDFHAFGELVMYPWAYTRDAPVPNDEKVFAQVTSKMAATNQYRAGQISKIIYIAKGSSADYFYWKLRSLSLGIEVGNSKSPSPSEFPRYIREQEESTWLFLETFTARRR